MLESWLQRFRQRDRRALARLLTLVARGEQLHEIQTGLRPTPQAARVVAITGSAGVGKSTLIGRLIGQVRQDGLTVAVLACDPQSPLSGGALLGDRFRMPAAAEDDGVFIRSLAAASGSGAVAEHLDVMVRVLEAFGFEVVIIETVGAGQGDTAISRLADVVVLLVQPEAGDDLQWEKAGLLEVADIEVIHKADLPGAERVEAQVRGMLGLSPNREVPVLRVSGKSGEGVADLWNVIRAANLRRGTGADERGLLCQVQESLGRWYAAALAARDPALQELVRAWQDGKTTNDGATYALLQLFQARGRSPA